MPELNRITSQKNRIHGCTAEKSIHPLGQLQPAYYRGFAGVGSPPVSVVIWSVSELVLNGRDVEQVVLLPLYPRFGLPRVSCPDREGNSPLFLTWEV